MFDCELLFWGVRWCLKRSKWNLWRSSTPRLGRPVMYIHDIWREAGDAWDIIALLRPWVCFPLDVLNSKLSCLWCIVVRTILLWVWFSIRQLKSSQRYSWIGRREWWRHHSGRKAGGTMWKCWWIWNFQFPQKRILHIEFFVGTWGWKRSCHIFFDDVRRCLSLKAMPYLMPSSKWRQDIRIYKGQKATAMMAKNLPNLGFRWSGSFQRFQVAGQDITERLKTLMATS